MHFVSVVNAWLVRLRSWARPSLLCASILFGCTLGSHAACCSGSFSNNTPITIHELGAASPYPAAIHVSGLTGVVSRVAVTLHKLSHTWPDDIDALLVGPQGQKLLLMSDTGGGTPLLDRTLIIDSESASPLPDEAALVNSSYRPANYEKSDTFFDPAPAVAAGSSFDVFQSSNPNGTWSLYIMDDSGFDGGAISGGWSLSIETIVPAHPIANLAVTLTHPHPVVAEQPGSYTIKIVNYGPYAATNLVVSNAPTPLDFTITSSTTTHGVVQLVNGVVLGRIPLLASGASAVITVGYRLNSDVPTTNHVTLFSPVTDPDLRDNSDLVALSPLPPVTDLVLNVTSTNAPLFASSNLTLQISVSNAGPAVARNVVVTHELAGGWTFLSATQSVGFTTNDGNQLHCFFGHLTNGTTVVAWMTLRPSASGVFTNVFHATLNTQDTNQANNVSQLITTVQPRTPLLAAAGAAIKFEGSPADGGISLGETVTMNFALKNIGTRDTTNLVATLRNSGGVSPVSGAITYGVLAAHGDAVSRPVTFTGTGLGELTATFHLQDGPDDLGTVDWKLPTISVSSVSSSNVIIVPHQGAANNYPSTITLSALTGLASKVVLGLHNVQHPYLADLDLLLVGPAGQKVLVMSDVGYGASVAGLNLILDDTAAGSLPFSGFVNSGSYRPSDYAPADTFPAPAPPGPFGTALSDFNGTNPNGIWSLYVYDAVAGEAGRINGGWSLQISSVQPLPATADIAIATEGPSSAEWNGAISYRMTVVNNGPAVAESVFVTNTLPVGFALSNVSASHGTVTTSGRTIIASLGSLDGGTKATILLTGTNTIASALTNVAHVRSVAADPVPGNDSTVHIIRPAIPRLTIQRSAAAVTISWLASGGGLVLQTSAAPDGPWAAVDLPVRAVENRSEVTIQTAGPAAAFYRLQKP